MTVQTSTETPTTLKQFFETRRVKLTDIFAHYCEAHNLGLTKSLSSFKRHFYLSGAHRRQEASAQ